MRERKRTLARAQRRDRPRAKRRARRKLKEAKRELANAQEARRSACAGLYVALGDSISHGYPQLLFAEYHTTPGVSELANTSRGGENSGTLRSGGQLDEALRYISGPSDTKVVTIAIGGADSLFRCFDISSADCPFRGDFSATLADLQAALAADPGEETLIAMAYYNANSGKGGTQEAQSDARLLGSDGVLSCDATGSEVGLNDIIAQEAAGHQALLANPYPAFKLGGQAFLSDGLHPNDAGNQAITDAFLAAGAPCAVPSG